MVLAALSSAGCSKSPQDKLQGKWVGVGVSQVHPTQVARAEEWVQRTHVEFQGNNVTVSIPAEEARTGTFKIAKAEGNTLDVVFKRKTGGEDKSRLVMLEDGKMRWILNGGVELMMKKE